MHNTTALTHKSLKPIDYLLVGHITQDLVNSGARIGGTVTYSGLTARALGLSVGIVTSCRPDMDFSAYEGIQIVNNAAEQNTTFRNIRSEYGRQQYLYHKANLLNASHIPDLWKDAPIIHLGPVANEVDPSMINLFINKFVFLTPQGWLRDTDSDKRVLPVPWNLTPELTAKASAIVISTEDVQGDEGQIVELASLCPLLVVTENKYGARVYWNGDVRHFAAPEVTLIEDTGAGDIFAAAFFARLAKTNDPWESTQFAVKLSAASVMRKYLDSIPSVEEINSAQIDLIA